MTAVNRPWLAAALDIGGTKIAAALVDETGGLHHRAQIPTPGGLDPEAVFGAVAALIRRLAAGRQWSAVRWIGVGSAGPVDLRTGTVSPVNIPAWRGFPLVERISGLPLVGVRPVELSGDAVAMTAAEHWKGAASGVRNALCLVVSTGVGAGLVLDGVVRAGPSGNAGHLGHISVDLDGRACPCGSRGCLEGLASGPAVVRTALEAGWAPRSGAPTAAEVAGDAADGHPAAIAAFDRAGRSLAAGIAATAALVDLDLAVVGGGVAQAGEVLFEPLRRHLERYASLAFTAEIAVKPAALKTDAGLVGAAALTARRFNALRSPEALPAAALG